MPRKFKVGIEIPHAKITNTPLLPTDAIHIAYLLANGLPLNGGATGQVLTKTTATEYDYNWETPTSGVVGIASYDGGTFLNSSGGVMDGGDFTP